MSYVLSAYFINCLLVSIRLLPIFVVTPIVPFAKSPVLVRILLCLVLASVLVSGLPKLSDASLTVSTIAGELLVGIMIAFGFHAASASLDFVGKLIDLQIGLNASGVFDPSTSTMTGMISELLGIAFVLVFLSLDMHHALLRSISDWLVIMPPAQVSTQILSLPMAAMLTQQFLIAFMLVIPVILGLWLTDIAFAFISRSMPQANIYFLALPVKLGVGFLLLLLTLPLIIQHLPRLFEQALLFNKLLGEV